MVQAIDFTLSASNSEAGFELVYQGSTTLLVEPLRIGPGERWSLTIRLQVSVAGERFVGPETASATLPSTGLVEVIAGHR